MCLTADQHLAGLGQTGQTCGGIDAVTKDVTPFFDHRAVMKTNPDGKFDARHRGQVSDSLLHFGGGLKGIIGGIKHRHHFVADILDDAPAKTLDCTFHPFQTTINRTQRFGVTQLLVKPRASRNVGEQYGLNVFSLGHACFIAQHMGFGAERR